MDNLIQLLDHSEITYKYTFELGEGRNIEYTLRLDEDNLRLVNPAPEKLPRWTRLEYQQCENCTLDREKHEYCPVAVNLVEALDTFKNLVSHQKAQMTLSTDQRTYSKYDDVQHGLSSLLGVLMTTSGCPVLDKLRPMVRTHLPFSSLKETLYRAVSMYIVAQHFRELKKLSPHYKLDGLKKIYEDISVVNHALCKRVRTFYHSDANINALIILNCMAEYNSLTLEDDMIEELDKLFTAYYSE